MSDLLLAYYADDFTGATDALECLELAGVRTVLFMRPPTPKQLAAYTDVRAVGVGGGVTRARGTDGIEAKLRLAFRKLRELGAPHVHYKVCSTFDSSPKIGSIGRAIDVGAEIFAGPFVPLVVGTPGLGRYCVFGNLFARMGIGSAGEIFRLDRHPSMSRHPVTPADESDLRLHLARQTNKSIGLVDVLALANPTMAALAVAEQRNYGKNDIILFDVLEPTHLAVIGDVLGSYARPGQTLFSVGSSAIETALGMNWREAGMAVPVGRWPAPDNAAPVFIASGSCSPVTSGQIDWALSNSFEQVILHPPAGQGEACILKAASECAKKLNAGASVILHTGAANETSWRADVPWGAVLGRAVRGTMEQVAVSRVCICGGDTSSLAARPLGIESLEFVTPLTPGAPVCRAKAPGSPADGVEFVFKGGQVGPPDYFGVVACGHQ